MTAPPSSFLKFILVLLGPKLFILLTLIPVVVPELVTELVTVVVGVLVGVVVCELVRLLVPVVDMVDCLMVV